MKSVLALFLTAILLLSMTATAGASDLSGLFGGLTEILGKEETEVYGVGETVELNGVSVTFDGVMEAAGSADFYLPEDGNIFLVCEFTIENKTDEDVTVSTMLSFSMKCDDKLYELSLNALALSAFAGKTQLDRIVEPGEKVSGVVGYEIPKEWKNFELKFTPTPFAGSSEYLVFSPYPEEPSEKDK